MPKTTKAMLSFLLLAAVYIGSGQLSANNDVFANAMRRCCNNGVCHNADCTAGSSTLFCDGIEYAGSCQDCMNDVYTILSCDKYLGPLPTWCNIDANTRYYASQLE